MAFKFKDVQEFQKKYKTKEEKIKALKGLSNEEIRHLAKTCGSQSGAIFYMKHLNGEKG